MQAHRQWKSIKVKGEVHGTIPELQNLGYLLGWQCVVSNNIIVRATGLDIKDFTGASMLDSFEFNKIAGAVLFTVLAVLGLGIIADIVYDREAPDQMGYAVEVPDAHGDASQEAVEEAPVISLASLLAGGDAEAGASVARKCIACHSFEEGGANKVGPNLYGILGRGVATAAGFSYSDSMQAAGGTWDYENLSAFLANPREAMPGTAMGFAGIRRDNQRADLLIYLQSISPDAPPLPQ